MNYEEYIQKNIGRISFRVGGSKVRKQLKNEIADRVTKDIIDIDNYALRKNQWHELVEYKDNVIKHYSSEKFDKIAKFLLDASISQFEIWFKSWLGRCISSGVLLNMWSEGHMCACLLGHSSSNNDKEIAEFINNAGNAGLDRIINETEEWINSGIHYSRDKFDDYGRNKFIENAAGIAINKYKKYAEYKSRLNKNSRQKSVEKVENLEKDYLKYISELKHKINELDEKNYMYIKRQVGLHLSDIEKNFIYGEYHTNSRKNKI